MNWLHSLSLRLLLIFVLATVVMIEAFRLGIGGSLREQYERIFLRDLGYYMGQTFDRRTGKPDLERIQRLVERESLEVEIHGPGVSWTSTPGPINVEDVEFEVIRFANRMRRVNGRLERLPALMVERGYNDGKIYLRSRREGYSFLMALDPTGDDTPNIRWLLLVAAFLLVLYLVIRWLFRPIEQIRQVVTSIGEGDLASRTNIRRKDELGDLGRSINRMADDIANMLNSKRDLLLALSHELRTPVTRARVLTELLEESSERDAMVEDLQEMERIITDLTEAERLSDHHESVKLEPVSIKDLVNSVVDEYFPDSGIGVNLPQDDPYVLLDPVRIRLLLKNLVENALRHTPEGRPAPSIKVNLSEENLELIVEDFGEGIAPEHLEKITDPFYRADPSRQRGTGGFGLGLYLCKSIAAAHKGELLVESVVGQGSKVTFSLNLPQA